MVARAEARGLGPLRGAADAAAHRRALALQHGGRTQAAGAARAAGAGRLRATRRPGARGRRRRSTFVNNQLIHRTALPAELRRRGVIVLPARRGLLQHPDLLREHFMAQPPEARLREIRRAPRGLRRQTAPSSMCRAASSSAAPIVVVHAASGAGAAVFPHTLVIAERQRQGHRASNFFDLGRPPRGFACGANDLYAGHGRAAHLRRRRRTGRGTRSSFQLNSTVVRRDARVQSLNLHLGGRQARHESLSQLQAPRRLFARCSRSPSPQGAQEFDQRTLQIHQAPNTEVRPPLQERPARPGAHHLLRPHHRRSRRAEDRRLPEQPQPHAQRRRRGQLAPRPRNPGQRRALHARRHQRARSTPSRMFYLQSRGIARPSRASCSSSASSRRCSTSWRTRNSTPCCAT